MLEWLSTSIVKLQRTRAIKTIKLTLQTSKYDLDRKMKQAQTFLRAGEQVQVVLQLRNRQLWKPDVGKDFLDNLSIEYLQDYGRQIEFPTARRMQMKFKPHRR